MACPQGGGYRRVGGTVGGGCGSPSEGNTTWHATQRVRNPAHPGVLRHEASGEAPRHRTKLPVQLRSGGLARPPPRPSRKSHPRVAQALLPPTTAVSKDTRRQFHPTSASAAADASLERAVYARGGECSAVRESRSRRVVGDLSARPHHGSTLRTARSQPGVLAQKPRSDVGDVRPRNG